MQMHSLYQCSHARVDSEKPELYCDKGHGIGKQGYKVIAKSKLEHGKPLEPSICQQCPDYDEIGGPIPKSERGWLNK